jgi:type III pantothenate kinase
LYHGTLATVRAFIAGITAEHFAEDRPVVIGTGAYGRLFEEEQLFDEFVPELSLLGLRRAVGLAAKGNGL